MQLEVETGDLDILGNPQPNGQVNHLEDDKGDHPAPGDGKEDGKGLGPDLGADTDAIKPDTTHKGSGAKAGQDSPDDPTNSVDPKDVKTIVITELPLDAGSEVS